MAAEKTAPVCRAHPIAILGNLWRVLYLIVIPVLRGFFAALQSGFVGWVSSAWADILILLLMVFIAVARWWRVQLRRDSAVLHLRWGVLFTGHTVIPWQKVVTLSVTKPFYLRPMGAVRLQVDTMGGQGARADVSVLLRLQDAQALLAGVGPGPQEDRREDFAPTTRSIVALSLLNSNSLAGIVLIATFISQSGRLLGVEFSRRLLDTLEETARAVAFGIPPAAAAIAYALLVGWVAGFALSFFRYKNMRVSRRGDRLNIRGGLVSHREYNVLYREINFIDIRQSLTTKVMGLYSLYISAVGYGKQKEDITCLIPTESARRFTGDRQALFPALAPFARTLPAQRQGLMRFVAQPLWPCLGIPAATALIIWLVEGWTSFALFAGLMAMVPALFFLIVRLFDYRTGGLARKGDVFTLRYSRGFYLHTVVVHKSKMVQVELRQGPFQRLGDTCDVVVRTRGEGRILHRCRAIRLEDARKLFA